MSTRAISYIEETNTINYIHYNGFDVSNCLSGEDVTGDYDISNCKSQEDVVKYLLDEASRSDWQYMYFVKKDNAVLTSKLVNWKTAKKPDNVVKLGWFGETEPHPDYGSFGWTDFK